MFEDGSVADADALVEQWIGGYDRAGILHGHIRWHQALGALDIGDVDKALAIYADVLHPSCQRGAALERDVGLRLAAVAACSPMATPCRGNSGTTPTPMPAAISRR